MFRVSFVSAIRPLATPGFSTAARNPQMSTFRLYSSLRPNALFSLKRSPLSPSSFSRQSRTFITDAKPIVYRPTQAESWKRFGITAVRILAPSRAVVSLADVLPAFLSL